MALRPHAITLLAFFLFLPATTQAQDATAPHLSPVDNVLYAHHHDSDTTELDGWMNTLAADPTANDIALGPSGQFAGVPPAAPARTLTLTLNPALTGTVKLDPTGNIVVSAYIGSGSSSGALRVTTEIKYGTATVATGAAQNHVYQGTPGTYGKVTWTLAPLVTEFAPGTPLVWTISMSGVAQAGFLGVSAERGQSNIDLPVLSSTVTGSAGSSTPQHHDLNGTTATIALTGLAANETHIYNWTSPGGALRLNVSGERAAGNATLLVRDATNTTLANVTYNGTAIERAVTGTAGNWTIHVQLQGFTGNLSATLGLGASGDPTGGQAGSGSTGPGGGGSGTGTRAGSTSGNATSTKDDKGMPGLALPALLAVVALAAMLRRRL